MFENHQWVDVEWRSTIKAHLMSENWNLVLCFRPQDSVSVTSSLSPSHTLASEACEETENKGSQRTKSRFSSSSSSSSSDQQKHHRDKRAFFWNTALIRLRNSFRSGNKLSSSDSSLPSRQKISSTSSAQENAACVRLTTSTANPHR